MNRTIREWVEKANGDYNVAGRELNVPENPNYDAICFHAQQCVEKLMKAVLILHGNTPRKTHDLVELDRSLGLVCEEWDWSLAELRFLSLSAVTFRYPGDFADSDDAHRAFDICTRMRARLLELLEQKP